MPSNPIKFTHRNTRVQRNECAVGPIAKLHKFVFHLLSPRSQGGFVQKGLTNSRSLNLGKKNLAGAALWQYFKAPLFTGHFLRNL